MKFKSIFIFIILYGCSNKIDSCISIDYRTLLFAGLPNYLKVENYPYSSNNLLLKIDGKELAANENCIFQVSVKKHGEYGIQLRDIKSNKILLTESVKFKRLPSPVASIKSIRSRKRISKQQILLANELSSQLLNWGYNIRMPIKQFAVFNFENQQKIFTKNAFFNSEQRKVIEGLNSGEYLLICDISVEMPNKEIRNIAPLLYEIY